MKKIIFYSCLAILLIALALLVFINAQKANLGITIPKVTALYEDSLQSSISSSATSITTVRGTDFQSRNLSGTIGFVIDEGTSVQEFVICSASGTALTSCLRGIDVIDGESEVTALKQAHRRGASIKISDYPQLAILSRILNGDERLPNHIGLAQDFVSATASTTDLATKKYVDTVGAGGFTASNISSGYGLYALGTAPETVGMYVSATSSALTFFGYADSQVRVKYNNDLAVTADGNLRIATSTYFSFTGGVAMNAATSTKFVVGTSNPTGNFTSGDLWVSGNSTFTGNSTSTGKFVIGSSQPTGLFTTGLWTPGVTSTASVHFNSDFCLNNVCQTAVGEMATSTLSLGATSGTGETTVATHSIAGGKIPVHGVLKVHAGGTHAADTNNLTVRIKYGATTFCAPIFAVSGAAWSVDCTIIFQHAAVQSAYTQGFTGTVVATADNTGGTIDSTAAQDLVLTIQQATSGTSYANEFYAEIIR